MLVQAGQNFRLIGANPPQPGNRDADDHAGRRITRPAEQQAAVNPGRNPPPAAVETRPATSLPRVPPAPRPAQDPDARRRSHGRPPGNIARNEHADHDDGSPRATASTYDRYLASLSDIGQVPFLLRFNAFSEAHLDSLENPAYAAQFRQPEGRLLFLPTFRGTRTLQEYQSAFGPGGALPGGYSVSPEFSYFTPAGGFTFGGAASVSRIGDSSVAAAPGSAGDLDHDGNVMPLNPGSSTSNYFSGALVAARRLRQQQPGPGVYDPQRGRALPAPLLVTNCCAEQAT